MHLSAETTAWFHLVLVLNLGVKTLLNRAGPGKAAETTKKLGCKLPQAHFFPQDLFSESYLLF
jgi:hypothetical protein